MSRRRGGTAEWFWGRVDKSGDCWIWTGAVNRGGYGKLSYRAEALGPRIHTTSHRFAYELASGPIPNGLFVLHRCDNRRCCRPDHLRAGTHEDNMEDMRVRGRAAVGDRNGSRLFPNRLCRGEDNAACRLTESQVREIRTRYVPRVVGFQALADEFGISLAQAHRIVKRETWRHVA